MANPSEQAEVPACAAIRGVHGIIFAGKRHHNCLAQIEAAGFGGLWRIGAIQGFMTTEGRFVDRREALMLMLRAGRVSANKEAHHHGWSLPGELASEDLY